MKRFNIKIINTIRLIPIYNKTKLTTSKRRISTIEFKFLFLEIDIEIQKKK